jgi:hypothetical protein
MIKMNKWQRRVLGAVPVVMVAMMLYPPMKEVGIANVAGGRNPGSHYYYEWIFNNVWGSVQIGLLFTQFFVVGVAAVVAWILCAD